MTPKKKKPTAKRTRHLAYFVKDKKGSKERVVGHLTGYIGDMMGKGSEKQRNGHLVLTNERLCFVRKGLTGEVFETIPIEKITSIEQRSTLGFRRLTFHTSHDSLAFKTLDSKSTVAAFYETVESTRADFGEVDSKPNSPVSQDPLDQLQQLANLKDAGVISEVEFLTKKAEILKRI